jgi:hypothetical protein
MKYWTELKNDRTLLALYQLKLIIQIDNVT